mgnify:FL=1
MTIRLLGPNDPAVEMLKPLLDQHPEWDARIEIIAWENYFSALMQNLNHEVCPFQAVFIPGHVWLDSLIHAGLLAPLPLDKVDPAVAADYHIEDLLPSIRQECMRAGDLFLVPWFSDGHIVFYRSDLVRTKNGQNMAVIRPSALAQLAGRAHQPPRKYGMALKAAASEIFLDWLPFLWDFGGELFDADLNPLFASPQGVEALEEYIALKTYCLPDVHTFGNAEVAEVLKLGQVGIAATWGGQAAAVFGAAVESGKPIPYQAGVYPQPWNATWGIGLPAHQPPEAWRRTAEWLLTIADRRMDELVLRVAGSPVRMNTYSAENFNRYFWLRAQWEMLQRCRTLPFNSHLSKILGVLYSAVYAAFIGEHLPRQSLQRAEVQIREVLKEG